MTPTGRIAGVVTDRAGTPVADIVVLAYDFSPYNGWIPGNGTRTATDGSYEIAGLQAGNHRVEFRDDRQPPQYVSEFYDNVPNLADATDIAVGAGATVANINAQLAEPDQTNPWGRITGMVTDEMGNPLAGIGVNLYTFQSDGGYWLNVQGTVSDATGSYELSNLEAGVYRVGYDAAGFPCCLSGFYDNAPDLERATDIVLAPGATVTAINLVLMRLGQITGVVTDAAGAPLSRVKVAALLPDEFGGWLRTQLAQRDEAGAYILSDLGPGLYRVGFRDARVPEEYEPEFYDDAATVDAGADIRMELGATVTGINAQLAAKASIRGRVTDEAGAPLDQIHIIIYISDGFDGWPFWGFTFTDDAGQYAVSGLDAGIYRLGFIDFREPDQYQAEFYADAPDLDHATDIPVQTGQQVTGIDVQMARVPTRDTLFLSTTVGGKVNGIRYRNEDILAYNLTTGVWSLVFDGSDVGIHTDLDDFEWLPDGSLLLTFKAGLTIPGFGWVDESDIVRFMPASLGSHTAGTFTWFLDGADVGLTNGHEDIDAVGITPDGRLVISTRGSFSVEGISGTDKDLLVFNAQSLGEQTAGSWELYFEGGDVGLGHSQEDIRSVWLDPENGDIYFTTKGRFTTAGGLAGDGNDIALCTPLALGADTVCQFALFADVAAWGLDTQTIDGLALGTLPPLVLAAQVDNQADDQQDESTDGMDDLDDDAGELFLPLVVR